MRKVVPVLSLLIVIVFALVITGAQAPQGGQGRGQAAAPARPPGVDAAPAQKMVAAAEAAAIALNAPMAIAVVDGNGDLVYFERMDGASARAVTSAQGKARAALLLGVLAARPGEGSKGEGDRDHEAAHTHRLCRSCPAIATPVDGES